jgi:hypothetical protein
MSKTADNRAKRRNPPPPDVYRIAHAAAIAQATPSTVYKWIRTRKITAIPHNGILYVHLQDVQGARRTKKRGDNYPTPPPLGMVTTRHASDETGASQVSIQGWARAKKIRAKRYGEKQWLWYVNLEDVQRMARESKPGVQK